jgi:hypothetical protein
MTHTEIRQVLDNLNIRNYTIRPNGVVDVDGCVDISWFSGTSLPVQFGKVTGKFSAGASPILSLNGFPYYIGTDLFIHSTNIESLSGIEKIIKEIHGGVYLDPRTTHILGLLLIPGITGFGIDDRGPIDNIMNKYIGTGDIVSAQDELIDAGFINHARM